MTAKEKAIELINKFSLVNSETILVDGLWEKEYSLTDSDAKQCALIAVDEIIKTFYLPVTYGAKEYWQQVKQEIEKL